MFNIRFFKGSTIKGAFKVLAGTAFLLAAVGYLAYLLSSLETTVEQVVAVDIPRMQDTLKDNGAKADTLSANMDSLTRRINEELMRDIDQLGKESKHNTEAVKGLSQTIDTLSRQYVNFLRLAEDKITVSLPPRCSPSSVLPMHSKMTSRRILSSNYCARGDKNIFWILRSRMTCPV